MPSVNDVIDLILTEVGRVADVLQVPVSYPGVDFTPPRRDAGDGHTLALPYLAASVLPNTTADDGISYGGGVNYAGILAVNVVQPSGQGVIPPVQLADRVVEAFAPTQSQGEKRLIAPGLEVRFYQRGRVAPPMEDDGEVTVPVTAEWMAFT